MISRRRPSWICLFFLAWCFSFYTNISVSSLNTTTMTDKLMNVQTFNPQAELPVFMARSPTKVASQSDVTPVGEDKLEFDDSTLRGEKKHMMT